MKNLIFSITCVFSFISLFAQQSKNASYLLATQNENSTIVQQLEQHAANYDISKNSTYDNSEKATYQITFKNHQGRMVISYNNNGEIITSSEGYKNVKIPLEIRKIVSKNHPKWEISSTHYTVNYQKGKTIQRSYKIQIIKGSKKKNLKINGTNTFATFVLTSPKT